MGALGAGLLAVSVVVLFFYGLGAVERRRWGGNVPTIQQYMFEGRNQRKSSISQLYVARWGRRTLLLSLVGLSLGGILMIVGATR